MRCLDGITDSMDMNLCRFQEMMRDREAWSVSYSPCHHEESDMTWQLNNNILNQWKEVHFFVSLFALMFIWLHWASVAACEI